MGRLAGVFTGILLACAGAVAAPTGFLERFALAEDREAVLAELAPGTEEYYWYHALHYQNEGRLAEVDALLKVWVERHGPGGRAMEMRYRQALLKYEADPEGAIQFLKDALGIELNHQQARPGQKPDLPTRLDPKVISRDALLERAAQRGPLSQGDLQDLTDSALPWFLGLDLTPEQRRAALERLSRPDIPNLVELVLADLAAPRSKGFGGVPIHGMLPRSQLDALAARRPELLREGDFVNTYLVRLLPTADEDPIRDDAARAAHLERLTAFVRQLDGSQNSLKAHTLYHRLDFDRGQGVYDRDLFVEYLQLPRQAPFVRQEYLARARQAEAGVRGWQMADLRQDYQSLTNLPRVGDDTALVQDYLTHFFTTGKDYKPYAPYLENDFLRQLFAETKILCGEGDMEQWYSWLPAERHQALKERVDLTLDPANPRYFGREDSVKLWVWLKNVDKLVVRVYEVNAENYYRRNGREINTDIDLDGLVANHERAVPCEVAALRRERRGFDFPEMDHPGVYVVEFIGNGKSSRAVVRKGQLHYIARTTPEGQRLTVLDEENRIVRGARVRLGEQVYEAGESNGVAVPFSTEPGSKPIILMDGDVASLDRLDHEGERYELLAGIHVDRESLRSERTATVVVRPSLRLNGRPAPLQLIEEPTLLITCTDLSGLPATQEVRDFVLRPDAASTHTFRVPPRLATITFELRGRVTPVLRTEPDALQVTKRFQLNGIEREARSEALHVGRVPEGYVVDLLDKTGLPCADRAVLLGLTHRDFSQPVTCQLQTDASGRIWLGELKDIVQVHIEADNVYPIQFAPVHDRVDYPRTVHAAAGEDIVLPAVAAKSADDFSVFSLRRGVYERDWHESLRVGGGFVTLSGLPRGDYALLVRPEGTRIHLSVAEGVRQAGAVMSSSRSLEASRRTPMNVDAVTEDGDVLTVHVANTTPLARVHVIATRYLPAFGAFGDLSLTRPELFRNLVAPVPNQYLSDRNIGEEYQYILDRRYAEKFPGNMLERPALLLNPWAVSDTETAEQKAAEGEPPAPAPMEALRRKVSPEAQAAAEAPFQPAYAGLDFLDGDAVVLANLAADADGMVQVPRSALNGRQHVHIIAADPFTEAYRQVVLAETPLEPRDLRLAKALEPTMPVAEQRTVSLMAAGDTLTLHAPDTAEFAVYDTVGKLYRLLSSLNPDPTLAEFGFVTQWPLLSPEEQRARYGKYACHELNLFLHRKDPAFFETVVRPHLATKRDKTFMDRWLLGEDLTAYLAPWAWERLNVPERILLTERIPGDRAETAAFVRNRFDLLPPDVDGRYARFMTALRGQALGATHLGEQVQNFFAHDYDVNGDGTSMAMNGTFMPGMGGGMGGVAIYADDRAMPALDAVELRTHARDEAQTREMAEELESLGYVAGRAGKDIKRRLAVRQLYRQLDQTKEWAERNWYGIRAGQEAQLLREVNGFWRDYANRDPEAPFLSAHVAEATRGFSEMMLALALTDLPFEASPPTLDRGRETVSLSANGPALVYHRDIRAAEAAEAEAGILLSEGFFRQDDRYRFEGAEQVDKLVTGEFLAGVIYGCQAVVTNPGSATQRLDLLTQAPAGAVPVAGSQYLRSQPLNLGPHATTQIEYYFYFPRPGDFAHYPLQVSKDGAIVARTGATSFHVAAASASVDHDSWEYVSQQADGDVVLRWLEERNLFRLNLDRIAWRMRDRAFHDRVTEVLRRRHAFNRALWAYAFQHGDERGMREFLMQDAGFKGAVGPYLDTPLLTFNPVDERVYEHLEYAPLVNARAHQLGPERQILNDRFAGQYEDLMLALSCRPALTPEDRMAVTVYLFLQDRVAEALACFDRIGRTEVDTPMQYDYLAAYAAFYRGDLEAARAAAEPYRDYPVPDWRGRFGRVLDQLDQLTEGTVAAAGGDDPLQRQTGLASAEPDIEVAVEANRVSLHYRNLRSCTVNYYLMDVELLFSRAPFGQQFGDHFATTRPHGTEELALPDGGAHAFDLPAAYRASNVMIEVSAAGKTRSQVCFANDLVVHLSENYGQVQVAREDGGVPLPKVYVKVYARMKDGEQRFYKDGYTDLRGRFDYASLSTDALDQVDRFALLIVSEDHGAVVREAAPPVR